MNGTSDTSKFIDLSLLISNINDEYIKFIVDILKEHLLFYHVKPEEVTKDMLIEKVYDYIETFIILQNKDVGGLPKAYCNVLFKAAEKDVVKNTRADQYLQKAENLKKAILKTKQYSKETIEHYKDFSRICFCLLSSPKDKDGKISEIDFLYDNVKIIPIVNAIKKEKGFFTLESEYCHKAFHIVMMVLLHYSIKSDISKAGDN